MATLPIADQRPPALLEDGLASEWLLALIVAGGFFGLFLGWAALTPLDAAAYARGVVEVAGNRQAVQHREGGVVTALQVKDGDTVRRGQPLLRIASADVEAEERGLASEYYMLLAQSARLRAEQAGGGALQAPPEFALAPEADRAFVDDALRTQSAMLRARRSATGAQKSVLGQRAAQVQAQIGGVGVEQQSNREQRRLIEEELVSVRGLADKGYVSRNRLRALERAAAVLDGDYGQQAGQVARAREQIGEQRMQSTLIDRTMLKEVDSDLRDVGLRLNEVRPRLAAARERLARTTMRAPAAGRVVGLSVFTVGGVVAAGQTVMEIVPDDRALVIKARIEPDDADDVRPGLATQVRFPSVRVGGLAVLQGRLETVSADSLTDERTGASYFLGEVRVPERELKGIASDRAGRVAIGPGVPAEILIPLAKRSMLDYLFEPLSKALWRAGREH